MPSKKQTKATNKKINKLTPTEKLKNQINELKSSIDESNDKHIRLKAEFDNYRKRKDKEIISLMKYEGEAVIKQFLNVLDDLERLNQASEKNDKDNYESLSKKMSTSGAELLLKSLDKINDTSFKALEQNDKKATYAPKIDKSFCKINWNESAQSIHSKVRALSPAPSAFTLLNGKRLKIYDTRLVKDPLKSPPGTITHIDDKILISSFDSQLELISVQYEGKKRMSAIDWIRGISYTSGIRFD